MAPTTRRAPRRIICSESEGDEMEIVDNDEDAKIVEKETKQEKDEKIEKDAQQYEDIRKKIFSTSDSSSSDDSDSDIIPEKQPAKVPSKRGRKPKNPPVKIQTANPTDQDQNNKINIPTSPKLPMRRGRKPNPRVIVPPSYLSSSSDEGSDLDFEVKSPPQKSEVRRGRKPKSTTEKQNNDQDQVQVKAPGKRGRPRIIKKVEISSSSSSSEVESQEDSSEESSSSSEGSGDEQNDEIPNIDNAPDDVERIICHRVSESGENEYMIKWKNKSYLHVSWRKETEFDGDRFLKAKFQRYLKKNSILFDEIDEPFNTSFLEVDRIIACTPDQKKYLVKWCSSSYAESTWELASDIKDQTKIDEFNEREKMPADTKDKKRPSSSQWKELKESPIFKNDNQLRSYQLAGLNWLSFCWYNQRNSILADEMGLGKTVQTVAVVNLIYNTYSRGPFLIIAPLSTVPHWKREFENWTSMNVIVYHGNSQSRDFIRNYEWKYDKSKSSDKSFVKFNVLITTYEMVMTDASILNKISWKYLAIDEAHRLKNKNCKLIGVLKTFSYEHLLLLTGTPLQNNTEELWTLLNLMDKAKFGSLDEFLKEFGELKETSQVEKLHKILRPYLLRRMKEDVEKSIAPKEETIIEVELTGIQKKYYRAIYDKNFESLNVGAKASNFPSLLNVMMQLRKCCNHPYLIKGVEENIVREEGKNSDPNLLMMKASGKLVLIDKLLPKLKNGGHKVLIFSQMVKMLDILEDYLHYKGYTYERIDGTKRANERQDAIDRFSVKGSDRFIFLLGTRAGGIGINLTAADTCIIYDSDWNPQNDLQAQARCHRIGQTQMVKIYRLITRNTYESIMFDKASKKLGLDKAVLTKMKGVKGVEKAEAATETLLNIKDKKEIDLLLKLGAYAFTEGNEDKYDEEDIDKILERSCKIHTDSSSSSNTDNTPSTFSKASFVSKGAASNADLDVNDPDFWIKIMPEKANRHNNSLIQDRPRTRKYIPRFEDEEEETSGSDVEDYEDEKEDKTTGWTARERVRLKSALLELGYGQWDTIRQYANLNWTAEEIRIYADTLLRKLIAHLGEDVEETMEILQNYLPPKNSVFSEEVGIGNDDEVEEVGNISAPVDDDVEIIEKDGTPTIKIEQNGDVDVKMENEREAEQPHSDIKIEDLQSTPPSSSEVISHIKIEDEEHENIKTEEADDALVELKAVDSINSINSSGNSNPEAEVVTTEEISFENDKSLTGPKFEDYKQHNAKLIVRRLEGIARVCRIIYEFVSEFKDNFTLQEIRDGPTSWWEPDDDESLVLGTYIHGYGQYEKMKNDPKLSFYSKIRVKTDSDSEDDDNEEENEVCEVTNKIVNDEGNGNGGCGDNDGKDENSKVIDDTTLRLVGNGKEGENAINPKIEWPSASLLNRRLRKLNRYLVTTQSTKERLDKIKEKELEKQRIKDEKQKKREELWNEWSKREKLDFYRTIVTHGIPITEAGDSDWNFIKVKARLTRKSLDHIRDYCEGLIAFSQNTLQKSSADDTKKEEVKEESEDQDLTPAQCKRLLLRIHMFKQLREKILPLDDQLPSLLKNASRPTALPLWWKPEEHDLHLIIGIAKHGFGQWEKICCDSQLSFFHLASDRLKLVGDIDVFVDDNNNNNNNNDSNCNLAATNNNNENNNNNDDNNNIENENENMMNNNDDLEDELILDDGDDEENGKTSTKKEKTTNNSNNNIGSNSNPSLSTAGGNNATNAKKKEIGTTGPYSTILEFPKDKVVLKRIDYLIKYILTTKEKLQNKLMKSAASSRKRKQLSIKDFSKAGKLTSSDHPPSSTIHFSNSENSDTNVMIVVDSENDNSVKLTATKKKFPIPNVSSSSSSTSSTSTSTSSSSSTAKEDKKTEKKPKKRARSPSAPVKKAATKRLQEITLNESGEPVFPIMIGKMAIECLGKIEYERASFHNERYIWPVGYRSVRQYRSFKNPDLHIKYISEIIDGGDFPLFRVTPTDCPEEHSTATSPSAAWSLILKKVSEKMQEKTGKRAFPTVSGPEFFGLASGVICKLIQELPNAEKCTKYKSQEFIQVEAKSNAQPKKKRKVAKEKDEQPITIPNNDNINNLADEVEEIVDSSEEEEAPKKPFCIFSSDGTRINLENQ